MQKKKMNWWITFHALSFIHIYYRYVVTILISHRVAYTFLQMICVNEFATLIFGCVDSFFFRCILTNMISLDWIWRQLVINGPVSIANKPKIVIENRLRGYSISVSFFYLFFFWFYLIWLFFSFSFVTIRIFTINATNQSYHLSMLSISQENQAN